MPFDPEMHDIEKLNRICRTIGITITKKRPVSKMLWNTLASCHRSLEKIRNPVPLGPQRYDTSRFGVLSQFKSSSAGRFGKTTLERPYRFGTQVIHRDKGEPIVILPKPDEEDDPGPSRYAPDFAVSSRIRRAPAYSLKWKRKPLQKRACCSEFVIASSLGQQYLSQYKSASSLKFGVERPVNMQLEEERANAPSVFSYRPNFELQERRPVSFPFGTVKEKRVEDTDLGPGRYFPKLSSFGKQLQGKSAPLPVIPREAREANSATRRQPTNSLKEFYRKQKAMLDKTCKFG